MDYSLEWPFAATAPEATGRIRAAVEDFRVDEIPNYTPDGEGEHALLHIRKRNSNTEYLARAIAQLAGVKPGAVSYAGLKDRHAVTSQWFSVHLPGQADPDWSALASEEIELLLATRHRRKIRRGALAGNRFTLVVRDLEGDREALAARLQRIAAQGVPNYFGEQRFGHDGGNLERAERLFSGALRERNRHKRGLYLSAARSWLFNRVLAARVAAGTWARPIGGDVMILDGRRSVFALGEVDEETVSRAAAGEIHPTGPLWGRGEPMSSGEAKAVEESALADWNAWQRGLEAAGLEQERRALRLPVRELEWGLEPERLHLSFRLDAGAYATTVLRELVRFDGS